MSVKKKGLYSVDRERKAREEEEKEGRITSEPTAREGRKKNSLSLCRCRCRRRRRPPLLRFSSLSSTRIDSFQSVGRALRYRRKDYLHDDFC